MELNNKSYLNNDSFSDIINKEFISAFPNKDFDKKNTINSSNYSLTLKPKSLISNTNGKRVKTGMRMKSPILLKLLLTKTMLLSMKI